MTHLAQRDQIFRIFVSSTFADLVEEREALQRFVFPRLRQLCASKGAHFQAIDLRWGVSEEATVDHRTMPICLTEIERCQRLTPRPNFVVLLGDRYGWCPLPPEIDAAELERLAARIDDQDDRRLVRDWYRHDDNAVPAVCVLKPRQGEFEGYVAWRRVERRLRRILADAVERLDLEPSERLKYTASATEQEILLGASTVPDARTHVFCFFRKLVAPGGKEVDAVPSDPLIGDFLDLDGDRNDVEARRSLESLKERLRQQLADNIHEYEAAWTSRGPTTDHIGSLPESLDECMSLLRAADAPATLCVDVWRRLAGVIIAELEASEQLDALYREIWNHERFAAERRATFVGRRGILAAISSYIGADSRELLAVVGDPGSGKSAVLAKAAEEAREDRPEAIVVSRFLGATPASSDIRLLLDSLCRELSRAYEADETTIPYDYGELVGELPRRLALATPERPLVLLIDALDQLDASHDAWRLVWLPTELPRHVRVVVSILPGEVERALREKHLPPRVLTLEPMTTAEGETLLDAWLAQAGRSLQPHQRREVLDRFAGSGLPFYLKLAFEEARLWRSYTPPSETRLHDGVPGVIRENLFRRLAEPANHGPLLVSRVLGYLAASRYGLAEEELLDVLSRDDDVIADFLERSPRSPRTAQLPAVVWSRLYFDLEPYLSERRVAGTTLLAFYHRQLQEVSEEGFLSGRDRTRRHAALAAYLRTKADPAGDSSWVGNSERGLSELPYHLARAEQSGELFKTLTDFRFLEQKAAEVGVVDHGDGATKTFTGVFLLQDDFDLALASLDQANGMGEGRRPLIVTAIDFGHGLVIRCPWCREVLPHRDEWAGETIACPHCRGPLRVNPFSLPRKSPPPARSP